MKSRDEFKTDLEYREYLRHYYSGLIIQGLNAFQYSDASGNAKEAVLHADALIKELYNEK